MLGKTQEKIEFSKFKINKVSFEVRYKEAYLLWDRSGEIWTALQDEWSNVKNKNAQPNDTSFIVDDRFEISVKINSLSLIDLRAKTDITSYVAHIEKFVEIVTDKLNISELSRIGLRVFFSKKYPALEDATEAFISTGILATPSGKHFNIDGNVSFPEYKMRWESDKTGVRAILKVQTKTIDFTVPPEVEDLESYHKETHEIELDIDYFTKAVTPLGKFKAKDWVEQAMRLIRRDSKMFLGEE